MDRRPQHGGKPRATIYTRVCFRLEMSRDWEPVTTWPEALQVPKEDVPRKFCGRHLDMRVASITIARYGKGSAVIADWLVQSWETPCLYWARFSMVVWLGGRDRANGVLKRLKTDQVVWALESHLTRILSVGK